MSAIEQGNILNPDLRVSLSLRIQKGLEQLRKAAQGRDLTPQNIGLNEERAQKVQKTIESRVASETDIQTIIQGIVPYDSFFGSNVSYDTIHTPGGEVKVVSKGKANFTALNLVRKLLRIEEAAATYNPNKKTIGIRSQASTGHAILSLALGRGNELVNISAAHEALHALQDISHTALDNRQSMGILRKAAELKKGSEISFIEAIQLEGRSRDLTILTESQAYILQYMLSGGPGNQDIVQQLKVAMGDQPTEVVETVTVEGLSLNSFSEFGLPSIIDIIPQKVRTYLPKSDQDNVDYINRIRTATVQIIKLLDLGMTHSQIADLLREHYHTLNEGLQWDKNRGNYVFLQDEINRLSSGRDVRDEDHTIKSFDQRNQERAMKIRTIAIEELLET